MAARPPKELFELLRTYNRGIQELALALREIVIEELAPCCEGIYEVYIVSLVYGATHRMKDAICYIGVIKDHVNMGFHRGTSLSDRHALLEGDGKQMRHIKIRNMDDLLNPAIRDYIQEACERGGHDLTRGQERTLSTVLKMKSAPKRSLGVRKLWCDHNSFKGNRASILQKR